MLLHSMSQINFIKLQTQLACTSVLYYTLASIKQKSKVTGSYEGPQRSFWI